MTAIAIIVVVVVAVVAMVVVKVVVWMYVCIRAYRDRNVCMYVYV